MSNDIKEIPIPLEFSVDEGFLAWMDWRGPDVLRLLHEGTVDVIHWNITDSERFEKVKHGKDNCRGQRVLCVTGPCPVELPRGEVVDESLRGPVKKTKKKMWGTRTVHVRNGWLLLHFDNDEYQPSGPRSRYDVGDRVYIDRDKHDEKIVWVGNADPRERWEVME